MKSEFEKLNEIYTSITDIDRILKTSDNKDKLDNVFIAIKNINRSELDQQIINNVISSIRNALVKVYQETLVEINKNITQEPQTRVSVTESDHSSVNVNDYLPNPILEQKIAENQTKNPLSIEEKLKSGNLADLLTAKSIAKRIRR